MNFSNLEKILSTEPSYRLKQARNLIFKDMIDDWSKASTLPLPLRERLAKEFPLGIEADMSEAQDTEAIKALITLGDGAKIETVLMRHEGGRNTVCVSSAVGCPLKCTFCATGMMGFKRDLEAGEIVKQVLFFARILKKDGEKVTNIVFMGMGEPFLNYDNVMKAIDILHDKDHFGLGARHFSISTVGIVEGIKRFVDENKEINLAISLHAPDDDLRSQIMPVNRKYPIKDVMTAVKYYAKRTNRRVMFEYIMIKDVNDSDECARKLAKLMRNPLYFVNLISYNPTGIFKASDGERIKHFKEILQRHYVTVTQRYRFGDKISAACGQLATKE